MTALPDPIDPLPAVAYSLPERLSWIIMAAVLFLVLRTGLLGALIAGMAVYTCVHALAPRLPSRLDSAFTRKLALGLLTMVIIGVLVGVVVWVVDFLQGDGTGRGLTPLLVRLAQIVSQLRDILPTWATHAWPSSAIALNTRMGEYLTENVTSVQAMGQDALKAIMHIILGMVLGGMAALAQENPRESRAAFTQALSTRLVNLVTVFRQVVFAQVKISAINTIFTAIFLWIVLPMTGNTLPFAKTLVLLTFVLGLVPVLGNLMSNTIITVMALSVSIWVAAGALVFLVVIHKLEYFLNARIIGSQIQARSWELLAAMVLMEACFGLPGVVAAPIYYAYLKRELLQVGWV